MSSLGEAQVVHRRVNAILEMNKFHGAEKMWNVSDRSLIERKPCVNVGERVWRYVGANTVFLEHVDENKLIRLLKQTLT